MSSSNSASSLQAAGKDCQFIGGAALSSTLTNILGLPEGDVPMLNEAGVQLKSRNCKSFNQANNGSNCSYIAEYKEELESQLCNASTFRLVSQIYINGCAESLGSNDNASQLFPNGSEDPEAIHLALTGRSPRSDEVAILRALASSFDSEEEKMMAVCAAIGSSLASINSF